MTGFASMRDVVAANFARGHHFFERETMAFFRSRAGSTLYGGRYFITSEQFDSFSARRYTVRVANDDGSVDTVGEFQEHATRAAAIRAAERLVGRDRVAVSS